MNIEFIEALNELEEERNIPKTVLLDAIEAALVKAYEQNYGDGQNVRVHLNKDTGDISVLASVEVVEEVYDPMIEMTLEQARALDPRYDIGDIIDYQVMPKDFGRIAAQTVKTIVIQRIRETERKMAYDEFEERRGEIINGIVSRKHGDTLYIDLGRTEGVLHARDQIEGEEYEINDRIKAYIADVKESTKGPQIFLSRSRSGFVEKLFELEVPEIQNGEVEIKSIAREAGSRTKMAVYTEIENIDPVGACVGARGARVQNVVNELGGEKIDIIPWSEDKAEFIASVLSPAKVESVTLEQIEKIDKRTGEVRKDREGNIEMEWIAEVVVPDYQLSLAIGKEGQNVRLAARVSDCKIDIKSHTESLNENDDVVEIEEIDDEISTIEIIEHEDGIEKIVETVEIEYPDDEEEITEIEEETDEVEE